MIKVGDLVIVNTPEDFRDQWNSTAHHGIVVKKEIWSSGHTRGRAMWFVMCGDGMMRTMNDGWLTKSELDKLNESR